MPLHPILVKLLYAIVLGSALDQLLGIGPPLADVPSRVWAVALAVVAFLRPHGVRWLFAAAVAIVLAPGSLPMATLAAGATLGAIMLAPEDPDHPVPVRFALLAATPLAAVNEMAILPLAIAAGIAQGGAWWLGMLQAIAIAGFAAATGVVFPWSGLPEATSHLAAIGGYPAEGNWWNRLGEVWDDTLLPWGAATLAQPAPYIRLVALWAFAGLVGGRAIERSSRALLRLPASALTPIIALLGLSYVNGTQPDPFALASGIGIGAMAFCLDSIVNSRAYYKWEEREEVAEKVSDDPPKAPAIRPAKWSDIGGYEDVKRELLEALKPLTDVELRARLASAGIEPTRGVLLYGPPGTGKTLMVRAAASELGIGFVAVAGPEVLNKYVGESEAGIRAAFEEARRSAPAILFFDEIEALVPPRSENDGMAGVYRTLVATFLGLMDGAKQPGEIVVMAATNAPDQMDSALLRPGRFDRVIYVRAPDPRTRRLILEQHLQGKPGASSIDVEPLVQPTERFTGADLAGVVRRAYEATQGAPISTEQLLALIKSTKPTVTLAMLDSYEGLSQRFGRSSQPMARMQAAPRPRLTWDDVAGLDEAKEALRETVILPLQHPDLVTKYGVQPSRGVLLYGPPGTGKTFLARVIADQAQATFLSASGAELAGPEGGEAIRHLFARAREVAPAIIFIDEIDAIRGRGSAGGWDTAVLQLLVEMDGVKPAAGIVVLAATNRPQDLDDALLRPGRFDTALLVSLPDDRARRQLFAMYLKNKPGAEAVDLDRLVEESANRSPAEIAGAVNNVARQLAMQAASGDASSAEGYVVTTDRLLEQIRFSSSKKS